MIYERQINKINESLAVIIPADLCRYLKLEQGDKIYIKDDIGKHGIFISMWTDDKKELHK